MAISLVALAAHGAVNEDLTDVVRDVRHYRQQHEAEIVRELAELVSLPNYALDQEGIARNAEHLVALLEGRGVSARLLNAPESPPAVYGELTVPGARRTVVFYAHYDGQPVDPERWAYDPYEATLLRSVLGEAAAEVVDLDSLTSESAIDPEWRLYGRSASDDKGPIVAMLRALDALRVADAVPSVNLKFFFEGEEERGSPHLRPMLQAHRDLLKADLWLFCDGPVHQSRRQQVVFGVRGVMGVGVTLYGPNRPLHSGHYGNWAPNPGARLANLISSMRDDDGRVHIEGFYEDVRALTAADRAALAAVPSVDDALRRELGLAASEAGNAPIVERILQPALNVQGLRMGLVGADAQNTIQAEAEAAIGFRLVPDLEPVRVRELFERHLETQGYLVLDRAPTANERLEHAQIASLDWDDGYRALRTPIDAPSSQALLGAVDAALTAVGQEPALRMPILGGSLPLYLFDDVLGAPLVVLPIVNHDNNQHAPNENLRLQNLWDGIELYAAVMAGIGEHWN